jgi:hypothetical protein
MAGSEPSFLFAYDYHMALTEKQLSIHSMIIYEYFRYCQFPN